MTLSHHRGGAGEPLLLLHGIGSHARMWEPALGPLEAEREVVALDLPGFGASPPLPAGTEPSPAALAEAVAAFLDGLGWQAPHLAGNSLGGWVALELARRGRARSVCALSPAGFWTRRERAFVTLSLRGGRAAARRLDGSAERLLADPRLRRLAFGQMVADAARMPVDDAVASTRNLATCPGWDATLAAMDRRHVTGAAAIPGPLTVAWAEHDRLLWRRQAERARRALPHARHVLLAGCGHVPTYDDPDLVARAILTSG